MTFYEKVKQIHGNKYDYSLVEYKNNKTKIKIICPEHGVFEQIPMHHTKGHGCVKCSNEKTKNRLQFTLIKFIEKAKLKHNNKYDYSLVDYKNNKTKVKIICPEHGIFEQMAKNHYEGQGCPKCAGKYRTTEEFIAKVKTIHNDKYDYSLVNYEKTGIKVKIICPEHGIFKQDPASHLQGKGCRKCKIESKGEAFISKYLNERNIKFKSEYIFDDCRNKLPLPFDFYLLDYNILIEYDGRQHYENIKYYGGEKGLKYRQLNDSIKNQYCINNNINLIRISYKENLLNKLKKIKITGGTKCRD